MVAQGFEKARALAEGGMPMAECPKPGNTVVANVDDADIEGKKALEFAV